MGRELYTEKQPQLDVWRVEFDEDSPGMLKDGAALDVWALNGRVLQDGHGNWFLQPGTLKSPLIILRPGTLLQRINGHVVEEMMVDEEFFRKYERAEKY